LVTVFLPAPYSPIDAAEKGTDTGQRFALFGLSLVSTWLLIVAAVVVVVVLVLVLRAAWPSLGPVRKAIRDAVLYALAIGGMGDRVRSRAFVRLTLAAMLVTLFFWPYVDKYFLGAGSDARVSTLGDMGFYVILALGLNVVVGFAGLLDLGYVAFFAFGAYTWAVLGAPQFEKITGLFAQLNGFPSIPRVLPFGAPWAVLFWPGLLIGALVGAFFGILLGAPTLRLRGDYLAIVTLGFGEIVPVVFKNMDKLTLGTNGISGIATPIFPGITFPWIASTTPFFYLMLGLIAIAIVCNIRLRDSRLGRAWVAIREDEIAAAASGINTVRTKLFAFATGAFFSGMAGVYSASKLGIIAPDKFSFGDSIIYLAMVVLGGIGSIPGVIVGAAIIASLNLYILIQLNVQASSLTPDSPVYFLHSIDFSLLRNFIFGGMLIVMMLLRPQGLIPSARRKAELTGEVAEETSGPVEDALDAAVGGPAYTEERVQ
jgi:branched-chain amino acid transport system permease protein